MVGNGDFLETGSPRISAPLPIIRLGSLLAQRSRARTRRLLLGSLDLWAQLLCESHSCTLRSLRSISCRQLSACSDELTCPWWSLESSAYGHVKLASFPPEVFFWTNSSVEKGVWIQSVVGCWGTRCKERRRRNRCSMFGIMRIIILKDYKCVSNVCQHVESCM